MRFKLPTKFIAGQFAYLIKRFCLIGMFTEEMRERIFEFCASNFLMTGNTPHPVETMSTRFHAPEPYPFKK